MTFLAYELARQLPLDLARAPLYSRVAAGEVTRAVWRCDLVSGGMGGSGQGQHECGGGGAGRGCGRDHALGGQDRADRASGTALADDAGLPVGVGLDDRVAVALFGNPVMMSGCMTIHTPGDPAAEDRVAVQALAVLAGRARQVTEFFTAQAGQPGLAAGQRTSVEARVRYLWNNQEYLRYDEALASGWPIAAGMVGIPWPPRARSPPPGPPPSHRLTEQVTTEELHPVHIDDFDPENLALSDTRP